MEISYLKTKNSPMQNPQPKIDIALTLLHQKLMNQDSGSVPTEVSAESQMEALNHKVAEIHEKVHKFVIEEKSQFENHPQSKPASGKDQYEEMMNSMVLRSPIYTEIRARLETSITNLEGLLSKVRRQQLSINNKSALIESLLQKNNRLTAQVTALQSSKANPMAKYNTKTCQVAQLAIGIQLQQELLGCITHNPISEFRTAQELPGDQLARNTLQTLHHVETKLAHYISNSQISRNKSEDIVDGGILQLQILRQMLENLIKERKSKRCQDMTQRVHEVRIQYSNSINRIRQFNQSLADFERPSGMQYLQVPTDNSCRELSIYGHPTHNSKLSSDGDQKKSQMTRTSRELKLPVRLISSKKSMTNRPFRNIER